MKQRIAAGLLTLAMCFSILPTNALAAENTDEADFSAALRELVDDETYPDGMFEFLSPRIEVEEGTEYVEFAVIRAGNTDSKAGVVFKAVDISAKYGEDYTITLPGFLTGSALKPEDDSKSMVESVADEAQENPVSVLEPEDTDAQVNDSDDEEPTTFEPDDEIKKESAQEDELQGNAASGNSPQEDEPQGASGINPPESAPSQEETALAAAEEVGYDLRSARTALTGAASDTSVWSEKDLTNTPDQDTKDALIAAYNNTYASLPGASCTLEFAPGENMKTLRFYPIDDTLSEDDELVMLVLSDAVGADLSENPTGLVNIRDNEPYEVSVFSIDEKQLFIAPEEDMATVTVRRTAGLSHMGEVTVSSASGSAEGGKYYEPFAHTVTFSTGQEYQQVQIPVLCHPTDEEVSFTVRAGEDSAEIVLLPDAAAVSYALSDGNAARSGKPNKPAAGQGVVLFDSELKLGTPTKGANGWGVKEAYYSVDLSMAGKVSFSMANKSSGTKAKGKWWRQFATYYFVGDIGGGKDEQFDETHYTVNLTDKTRQESIIRFGTKVWACTKDTDARIGYCYVYYLPIQVQLCAAPDSRDHDSYLYTRTYTSPTTYTENETSRTASYIGGLKFAAGTGTSRTFYNNDTVSLAPDYTNSGLTSEEHKGVYLWGVKLESTDMNKFGYYYIEGTSFSVKDLFTGNQYGYYVDKNSGEKHYGKIPANNIRMNNNGSCTFRVYPVYRQKTVYLRMTIDGSKSTFSNGTFKNNDVTVLGPLDTIKFRIAGTKSYAVQGYQLYAQNYCGAAVTPESSERNLYKESYPQYADKPNTAAGAQRLSTYSPYDIVNNTLRSSSWPVRTAYDPGGAVKGEFSITPAKLLASVGSAIKGEIHLVANYEQPSINMTVNPAATYVDGQKQAEVAYTDSEGHVQTARFTGVDNSNHSRGESIVISPFFANEVYDFTAVITDPKEYKVLWTDMTGDTNHDGKIDSDEKAAMGRYYDVVSDRTYSGDVFRYSPNFMANRQLYYWVSRRDPNQTGLKGQISGYIYYNSNTVLNNGVMQAVQKPLSNVQVVTGGQTVYTDKDGYFLVESLDFTPGETYNVVCNYGGQIFSAPAEVNRPVARIVLDEYAGFNVRDFKAYTVSNSGGWKASSKDNMLDVTNKDERQLFTFKIDELSTESVGKVEVCRYSSNGTKQKTYSATFDDDSRCYVVNATPNDANDLSQGYYSWNPAAENISAGDYLSIIVYDQNNIPYTEHLVGFKYQKYLSGINLINSFESPFNGAIEFLGKADVALNLGLSAKLDSKLGKYITIVTTQDPDTEILTKTISAGWDKDWKDDYDSEKSAKDKAKELAKGSESAPPTASPGPTSSPSPTESPAPTESPSPSPSADVKDLIDTDSKESKENERPSKLIANYSFGIKVAFSLSMKQDPGEDRWYFEDFVIVGTLSGDSSFRYSYTTPIGVTVFITGGFGGDITATMGVERYYTNKVYFEAEGTDDDPRIDLRDIGMTDTNRKMTFYGQLDVNPTIRLGAGAGVGKVAEVEIDGTAAFNMSFRAAGNGAGKVKLTGELKLTLLGGLIKKSWLLGQYQYDLFSYSGGTVRALSLFEEGTDFRYDTVSADEQAQRSYLSGQSGWNAMPLRTYSGAASSNEHTLIENVYPDAYPLIETIAAYDEGLRSDQLMVWLDDDGAGDDYNRAQLKYSIYSSENGSWSAPEKVDDDNTNDDSPMMYSLDNGEILVVWSSAEGSLNSGMAPTEMLNSRNIKARFFDTAARTFGKITNLTMTTDSDQVSDDTPCFAYCEKDGREYLMVCYVKSQYTSTGSNDETLVGDLLNPYSTVAYRFYDFEKEEWVSEYADGELAGLSARQRTIFTSNWYGQGFVDLSQYVTVNENGIADADKDSYTYGLWTGVPDSSAVTMTSLGSDPAIVETEAIGYNGLALMAYVVDLDGDTGTVEDTEIFLQIYDFEAKTFYPAIRLTADTVNQSYVELEENGEGGVSLFYIHDGDIVEFDATQLLESGLRMKASDGTDVWLLDKSQTEYAPPVRVYDAPEELPLSEFIALSDGNNIFLTWPEERISYRDGVDPASEEATLPENYFAEHQLYLMMKSGEYENTTVYDDNGNGEEIESYSYSWSKPVALTQEQGANYTDIDFVMARDGVLRCVYLKAMSEIMEVDGQKISVENKNARSLMTTDFDLSVSEFELAFDDLSNVISGHEETSINISVHNESVLKMEDLVVNLYQQSGTSRTLIDTTTIDRLDGGDTTNVSLYWDVPNPIDGAVLVAALSEGGLESWQIEHTFTYKDDWTITDVSAEILDRDTAQVTVNVTNNGAQASTGITLSAQMGDISAASDAFTLEAGESKQVSWAIPLKDSAFTSTTDDLGGISEQAVISVKGRFNDLEATISRYTPAVAVNAFKEINTVTLKNMDTDEALDDTLALKRGELIGLSCVAEGADDTSIPVSVIYSSSNPSAVDIVNGVLQAKGSGTAVITVTVSPDVCGYYFGTDSYGFPIEDLTQLSPKVLKTTELTVSVSGGNGSGSGSATYSISVPGSIPHGSVAVSPKRAGKGDLVTITAIPDDGYAVGSVSVTDENGREIPVAGIGGGKYSFTMPAGAVTVDVSFIKADSYAGCPRDASCPIHAFTDADTTAWYHDGVHYCIENGLMNGCGRGIFAPNANLTRGMLAQILYNEAGQPALSGDSPFDDVAPASWYADAVRWAADQGIVTGYGNRKFGPDDPITREQLAVMLWRYAQAKEYDVSVGEDTNILSCKDFKHISDWAIPALQWAVGSGVVAGKGDGILDPTGNATRAEAAAVLQRYLMLGK